MIEVISFIKNNLRIILGIVFIFINLPLGWIGLGWFARLALKTKRKMFYILGLGIYGFSWALLALGVFLCGEDLAYNLLVKYKTFIIIVTIIIALIIVFALHRESVKNKSVN